MAWSTRELAEISGTTVNTVRHYHRLGILDEPVRAPNGYKQYDTRHLVRLLHLLQLRDLGVPISQIERNDTEAESTDFLPTLDATLAASIERLQRARAQIRTQLEIDAPPSLRADDG